MLGIDGLPKQQVDELKGSHWRLCALVIHAYNLKNGLICTGFDEDDPQMDENALKEGGLMNITEQFCQDSRHLMSFRYKRTKDPNETEEFWFKVVPLNFDFDM